MKIEIDRKSGFCFGVINAINKAESELGNDGKLYCLGDIVHNDAEVARLKSLGMETITHEEFFRMRNCRVLIRAHGEPPETYRYALENQIELIDATCPVVLMLQKRVKSSFKNLSKEKGQLVFFGKPGHAETTGISGQIDNKAIVVRNKEDLEKIDFTRPIELYSQTTMSIESFNEMAKAIRERAGENQQVIVRDTICRQVANRGPHLREFAARYQVVIFVAGDKSSNGAALYAVCKSVNPHTYKIEDEAGLNPEWFAGIESVGICGATSTPRWLMEKVAAGIRKLQ
jgi:4-hydroxy-3-methylbut-2-enyl diphosphate reductase